MDLDTSSINASRMRRILQFIRFSKDYRAPLAMFFFGHTSWMFDLEFEFSKLFGETFIGDIDTTVPIKEGVNHCVRGALPLKRLNRIKHITLFAQKWAKFQPLFHSVHSNLTKADERLKNLELIEIIAPGHTRSTSVFNGIMTNQIDMKPNRHPEHETDRIRDLVTHCWEIVNKRPKIKISFKGPSKNSYVPTPEWVAGGPKRSRAPPKNMEELLDEEMTKGSGFGFSDSETEQFLAGTSELLSGLKHIEFPNTNGKIDLTERKFHHIDYHWQMKFAVEWRKLLRI